MFRTRLLLPLAMLTRLTLLIALLPVAVLAQDASTAPENAIASGRIIGRVWYVGVRPEDSFGWLQKVREELQVPQSPIMINTVGRSMSGLIGPRILRNGKQPQSDEKPQLSGVLFVLETRPEITLGNPISFEFCESLEKFTELVKQQQSMMGPMAELSGEDSQYTLKLNLRAAPTLSTGPPQGSDAPKETRSISIVIAADVTSESGAPAGKPAPIPTSIETHFRYYDGVMYSSRSNAVFSLNLPDRQSLQLEDENAGLDLFADFELSQIPPEFRTAFRSALESQVSTFLQQFDSEQDGEYALRRVLAEGRFELLKSALFDVDRVRFSLKMSPAPGQPVVSRLRVQARPGSPLAAGLSLITSRSSQLSALHDKQSPLLVAGTLAIPEALRPFGLALTESVALRLKETTSELPSAAVLIDEIAQSFRQSVESGVLDGAVCLRGTVADGLIPCAAVRLEAAESFLNALELLLQVTAARDYVTVKPGTAGSYRMLTITAEDAPIPFTGARLPLQLHIAATGSWLWLTLGNDRALTQLQELTSASEESLSQNASAVPLRIRMNLDGWLGKAADPMSEVPAKWLETVERWLKAKTAPRFAAFSINGQNVTGERNEPPSFNSYSAKALKSGDAGFDFTVRTAGSELLAEVEFGRGLANFAVAQFLDAQSRMFEGVKFQFSTSGGQGNFKLQLGGPEKK